MAPLWSYVDVSGIVDVTCDISVTAADIILYVCEVIFMRFILSVDYKFQQHFQYRYCLFTSETFFRATS